MGKPPSVSRAAVLEQARLSRDGALLSRAGALLFRLLFAETRDTPGPLFPPIGGPVDTPHERIAMNVTTCSTEFMTRWNFRARDHRATAPPHRLEVGAWPDPQGERDPRRLDPYAITHSSIESKNIGKSSPMMISPELAISSGQIQVEITEREELQD
ncbi:hypothetical protein DFH27DRAFT_613988 [Peziza echinospora]|nr:hypothetical protein DFH27DRAFT_613988 [Peziza echinospora]